MFYALCLCGGFVGLLILSCSNMSIRDFMFGGAFGENSGYAQLELRATGLTNPQILLEAPVLHKSL